MQKLLHTLLLLAFISSSISLTSCLSGNDDDNSVHYSDCAISSFRLGTLNKYTKTVSSKTGNDTIIKTTVTGSEYRFTINQQTHEIYNVDSLPAGIDTLHVVCNINAFNGGYIYIESDKSDSIFAYNSTDSISFKKNPRTLRIYSNDGLNSTKYTVKLNVHTEEAAQMTWNAPTTVPQFTDADHIQSTEWNGYMLVKAVKGDDVTIYTSGIDNGKAWATLNTDIKISKTASISALGTTLYTSDDSGNICSSTDGEHWQQVAGLSGNVLGISAQKLYYLSDGVIYAYDINAGTTVAEQFFGITAYPFLADQHASLCEVKKDKKIKGTSIIGATVSGYAVLYKAENTAEQQKWMLIANEAKQNLPGAHTDVVSYGEFLLALTGGKFYTSLDYGRSWQQRYYVNPPTTLPAEGASHLFADSRGIIWIFAPNGQVYTGKINGIAWEK